MKYGKINENGGYPTIAAKTISYDGKTIVNPTDEQYREAGYLPVVMVPPPATDELHFPEAHWEQRGDQIVQVWEIMKLPPREPSPEERIAALEEELKATKILLGVEV